MKLKLIFPFVLFGMIIFSCGKDDPEVIATEITFEAQIFEVLESITDADEIGQIIASSNMSAPITFSIIENSDNLFTVNDRGGCGLATGRRLNYKNTASHQIVVEATDGEKSTTATITINVIDVPDPFISTWKTDDFGISNDNQVKITTNPDLTYNYTIDWGDGMEDMNVSGDITHTYAASGTYTVSISGTFPAIVNEEEQTDSYKIKTIEQWGDIQWLTMEEAFMNCEELVINASDAPDLSQVTSMQAMFAQAYNFTGDLSGWDVSNITDMSWMFSSARTFNSNLESWNVSSVTNIAGMFSSAFIFNSDLSSWDVSNVTDMSFMFRDARAFQGNIDTWDVSNVTSMKYMLFGTPNVSNLSNWDVSSVTDMDQMFRNATFNGDVSSWNVSNVTTMRNMFRDSGLSQANYDALLAGWSSLTLQNGVELGMGNLKYDSSMQSARDILTNNFNWSITDGGADF